MKKLLLVNALLLVCLVSALDLQGQCSSSPTITGSSSACLATYVTYSTESGMTAYSWTVTGGSILPPLIQGATIQVYWSAQGPQSVSVNYTDAASCRSTSPTTKSVTINPLPIPTISGNVSVCQGSTGNIYTTEAGQTSYRWFLSGIPISGETSNSVAVTWTTPGNQSIYVTYVNSNGCITPGNASNPYPVYKFVYVSPLTSSISGSSVVCLNDTNIYSTESGKSSYNWSVSGGTITGGIGTNSITVNWNNIGIHSLSVNYIDPLGCVSNPSANKNVNVLSRPVPVITGSPASCVFSTTNIYSTDSGMSSYNWAIAHGGGASPAGIITSGQGTSSITVTWNYAGAQSLSVSYTNAGGCAATVATVFSVNVNNLPNPSISGVSTICQGSSTILTANGASTYNWSPSTGLSATTGPVVVASPASTTTYVLTGSDGCSNTATTSITITVNALPIITLSPSTGAICIGASINLTSNGALSYSWSPVTGLSASNGATVTASPTISTTYIVTGTNANGCSNSATATVTVNPLPIPTISGNVSVCQGSTGNIYTTEAGQTSYRWFLSGIPISGEASNSVAVTWTTPGNQSIYVTYANSNGCITPGTPSNPYPVYKFVYVSPLTSSISGSSVVCINDTNIYSTESGKSSYNWSVSGGTITGGIGTNSITVNWNTLGTQSLSVSYVDPLACISTPSANKGVNVLNKPIPIITGNPEACLASTNNVYSTESGMTSYNWIIAHGGGASPAGIITSGQSTNSITVTWNYAGPQSLSVNYVNTGGCSAISPSVFNVNIDAQPNVSITGASSICQGTSTVLTASGASIYNWFPATGLSATSGSVVTASPTSTTNYTVTGSFGCLPTSVASITLIVNALPVAAGGNHSIIMSCGTCGGGVLSNGLNTSGQLGDGTLIQKNSPVSLSLIGTVAVAAGTSHTLFLKNDGTVWATGLNTNGQLGDGTLVNKSTPIQVSGLTGIVGISAGNTHSLFLKSDGTVWACGLNSNGQLGDGTLTQRNTPVQVTGLTGITKISGGGTHSLFLKNDGTAWACGRNANGQLGDGTTTRRTIPVVLSSLSGITQVSAGGTHSHFLKNDGTVWGTGLNTNGQLGDGTTVQKLSPVLISSLTNMISVSGGATHTLFLKNNGTAWSTGLNTNGQLGDGTLTQRITPVQVSGLSGATALDAGATHSMFLKNDGFVWACGRNANGQLGDGTITRRTIPVQIINVNPCGRIRSMDQQEITVAIDDLVDAYPNPANSELTVDFAEGVKQVTPIALFDGFGRLLLHDQLNIGEATKTLNISELPGGMYFLRLNTQQGLVGKKIMIVH